MQDYLSSMRETTLVTPVEQMRVESSNHLHQEVFADPKSFLDTLKKDYHQIPAEHSGLLTQKDLANYARFGPDQNLRSITATASRHFTELQKFSQLPKLDGTVQESGHWTWSGSVEGLSKGDLQTDLDLIQGRTERHLIGSELKGFTHAAFAGGCAFYFGTAALAWGEEKPLRILAGVAAFAEVAPYSLLWRAIEGFARQHAKACRSRPCDFEWLVEARPERR